MRLMSEYHQKEDQSESESSDEDPEKKWDCETVLTTYTNTDNHPGIIKTERRVKP
jgi:protein LTV1